jgi:hypothetical protein
MALAGTRVGSLKYGFRPYRTISPILRLLLAPIFGAVGYLAHSFQPSIASQGKPVKPSRSQPRASNQLRDQGHRNSSPGCAIPPAEGALFVQ